VKWLAVLLALYAPAAAQVPEGWVPKTTAELILLDKIKAQPVDVAVKVGDSTHFGSLTIKVTACDNRPPDQPEDSAAFVEVSDARGTKDVFRGWILANTPSVSEMQHPLYDLRLAGCR
jgi:hypothetical protein